MSKLLFTTVNIYVTFLVMLTESFNTGYELRIHVSQLRAYMHLIHPMLLGMELMTTDR